MHALACGRHGLAATVEEGTAGEGEGRAAVAVPPRRAGEIHDSSRALTSSVLHVHAMKKNTALAAILPAYRDAVLCPVTPLASCCRVTIPLKRL